MKKEELKIGSSYNFNGKEIVMTPKKIKAIISLGDYDTITPIEITDDRLIAFGFKKRIYDYAWAGYGHDYILKLNGAVFGFTLVYESNFSLSISCEEDENAITPHIDRFKYVHQLQALYFALTSNELKAK